MCIPWLVDSMSFYASALSISQSLLHTDDVAILHRDRRGVAVQSNVQSCLACWVGQQLRLSTLTRERFRFVLALRGHCTGEELAYSRGRPAKSRHRSTGIDRVWQMASAGTCSMRGSRRLGAAGELRGRIQLASRGTCVCDTGGDRSEGWTECQARLAAHRYQ